MYRQKYNKYKHAYLKLKRQLYDNAYITKIDFPDIERDSDFFRDDRLIKSTDPAYPYYFHVDDKDTLEIRDLESEKEMVERIPKVFDIGVFGLARGKLEKLYNISEGDLIKLEDGPNKNKILLIDNLDDFDNFTYKYGAVDKYTIGSKAYGLIELLYIKWNKVAQDYKGIYIDKGLKEDRYYDAYYNGKYYSSWWSREYDFDLKDEEEEIKDIEGNVLIFVFDELDIIKGEEITELFKGKIHFKGKMYKENDFPEDNYISEGKDPDKILRINSFRLFDSFTNEYGFLTDQDRDGLYAISIDWEQVKAHYKGFYIDKDNVELFNKRYLRAFYKEKKYESWWFYHGIKQGIVYIFSKNDN